MATNVQRLRLSCSGSSRSRSVPWRPLAVAVAAAALMTACASSVPSASPVIDPSSPATPAPVTPSADVGSGTAAAPSPGTALLASLPTEGRVNVIAGSAGFTVVQSISDLQGDTDRSTATAYDAAGHALATIPAGSFTGECGAADVSPGGKRLIVAALVTTRPAAGVDPAQYSETITAWDALSGREAWTTQVVDPQGVDLKQNCSAYDGELFHEASGPPMINITNDGAWGALHLLAGNTEVDGVLELATGHLYPRSDVLGALGNFMATGNDQHDGQPLTATVTLPPTWSKLGTFPVVSSDQQPGVLARFGYGPSSGVFTVVSAGSSPTAATSQDGKTLFTYEARPDGTGYGGGYLKAYRLPEMTVLWTQPPPSGVDVQLVAEGGGVLIVRSKGQNDTTMQGLDAATGAKRWSLPQFEVCGLTRSQILASANDQLAVIDLASGRQLSFTKSSTSSCPTVLPGGQQVDGPGGGVSQTLVP